MKPSAYEAYRKVRNKLRKYEPKNIIFTYISNLMRTDACDINRLKHYPPWVLLLLIKWTLTEGELYSAKWKPLHDSDFNRLINLIHDFSGSTVRKASEYEHPFLLLRPLAFQQFWIQETFSEFFLARQSILFGHLGKENPIGRKFRDSVGITINDFNVLGMALLQKFHIEQEAFVTRNWFEPIEHKFPSDTIDNFLDVLSQDLDSIREYLNKVSTGRHSVSYEFYEETPIKRFPLLKDEDKYFCYSKHLLFHSLQTFVYDFLRAKDASGFMKTFGEIFERYVEKAISYSGVSFLKEEDLENHLGADGIVDFLLEDDGAQVFVEAKGGEMAYVGKVSHVPEVVRHQTTDSILKAIEQAYKTAKLVSDSTRGADFSNDTKENYLLVVTYKQFYVGSGKDFYEAIAKEKLDRMVQRYGGRQWIPFENMYFLSINELELFVHCVRDGLTGLAEGLRKAVEVDSNIQTKKWDFRLHIDDMYPEGEMYQYPEYLSDEFDFIYDSLLSRFKTQLGE